ncbi:Ger(x)C family spore germination protein [Ureibacillus acetophenoni]|uniref:Ger(X)C family germination protein n=1 Tax=Ureibacillus acetophenoni TaxID=614649 RepID=A0A285UGX5_9BACL|nr:Ger(x)C family spore germination protein [Ureibacillus acetophenoni]SOC41013.1 Ger(x)C family germination protein [Ureibacillus acetophenoni]
MNHWKQIIPLLLLSILLSGCWDSRENERMFYVHGVGIDYKDEQYEVFMQIISFSNVAKSEQVNQDVIQSEVNSAKGNTFTEALFQLYHAIDEEVYWGHLSFFIVTEDLMKKDHINSIINTFTQHTDTRYQTLVYCTDEPLEEFLLALPLLKRSITLTKLADPYNSFEQASYIEPLSMRQLIIQLNEPSYDVKIPYVTMNKDWKTQKGPDESVEISGVGVIAPNQFKGFIKEEKAKGLQWLSHKTTRAQITSKVDSSKEDDFITVVLQGLKVQIEPVIEGKEVKFDITLNTTVSLNSYSESITTADIRETVEKAVKKEIETTFKEGLKRDADIYRLSEILYRSNNKAWSELHTDGKIPLTEKSIHNINIIIDNYDSGRKSFKTTID